MKKNSKYHLCKERAYAASNVKQNMPGHVRQILAKFMSRSLLIHIETGCFEKIHLEEWYCDFCNGNHIEDETHVLLHCELYDDLRYELFQHMCILDKGFMVMLGFILL